MDDPGGGGGGGGGTGIVDSGTLKDRNMYVSEGSFLANGFLTNPQSDPSACGLGYADIGHETELMST